ncbi:MAG: hypothetical protein LBS55_05810 [Prevotellaceae bacterium]|nr:hypothetical protein [Prevotellaceae bacterium]
MRNLIGLITLFSIAVSDAYSQVKREQIVFDTVFEGGYFRFRMDNMQVGPSNNRNQKNNLGNVNIIELENQRREEDLRAVERYIDSIKVVMFTNTMGLTKSEAAVFWPTYENYQSKLNKIHEKRKEANAKVCDPFRRFTDREYQAFVNTEVKSYKEEALLREQYAEEFKKILGDKLYLLFRAEHLFRRWVFSAF